MYLYYNRCEKWVLACGLPKEVIPRILQGKKYALCTNHFEDKDYKDRQRRLVSIVNL